MVDLDKIREMRKRGFNSETATADLKLGSIVNDLDKIEEDMERHHLPKISESMFVNKYLMAFAGVGTDISENYATYLEWISDIAGNYNIKVQVCDDRSKEVLFTVPAISNVKTLKPEKAETREVKKAIAMAEEARFLQPFNWETMLKNNLNGILRKLYDSEQPIDSQEQKAWLDIFKRYEKLLANKHRVDIDKKLSVNDETNIKPASAPVADKNYDEVDDPI